jgi:hypothetical protein
VAGGVPRVSEDLARVAARVEELTDLRAEVQVVRDGVVSLREDSPLPSLVLGVAGLREDVEDVAVRLADLHVPTAEAVAVAVEQQVVDPLVDVLAPRVAELVLHRVAATLVEQVASSVTTSVQHGLTERVRAATVDSERRISAHVDEAVLVLAEALLRRRRVLRTGGGALGGSLEDAGLEPGGPPADPGPALPATPSGDGGDAAAADPSATQVADEAVVDGAVVDGAVVDGAVVDGAVVDEAEAQGGAAEAAIDESGASAGAGVSAEGAGDGPVDGSGGDPGRRTRSARTLECLRTLQESPTTQLTPTLARLPSEARPPRWAATPPRVRSGWRPPMPALLVVPGAGPSTRTCDARPGLKKIAARRPRSSGRRTSRASTKAPASIPLCRPSACRRS